MKPPTMDDFIKENMCHWLSVFEALLRCYPTVSEAFLRPRIAA
jgi:hypothetical protein